MKTKAKMLISGWIIKALDAANVDPALVKALIKKPPIVHGGPRARRFPWPKRRHFGAKELAAV